MSEATPRGDTCGSQGQTVLGYLPRRTDQYINRKHYRDAEFLNTLGNDIRLYRQDEGLAMGSPLSPTMANIYMEYFAEMTL